MKIELIKGTTEEEIKERTRKVATAGLLSHADESLFDLYEIRNDHEDNIKKINGIISIGHESIIEHDQLTFGITEVTPIIEHLLIGQRLASFTIKSRRYVDFSNSGFYKPDFTYLKNSNELNEKYYNHAKYLFETYSKMIELGVTKEDARFILPYSFHSEIVMSINPRSLKKLIIYCTTGKMSEIKEVKEFGQKLLQITKEKVPYLKKQMEKIETQTINDNHEDELKFLEEYCTPDYKLLDKTSLISIHSDYEDIDKTIIVSYLMNRYQYDHKKSSEIYEKLNNEERLKIMDIICNSNEQRELEHISFKFQFPITLAVLTHITRHRMHSLLIPDFIPMWDLNNHIIPDTIKETCLDIYEEAHKKNIETYNEFKNNGVQEKELIYFYLSGNMCNATSNINGREMMLISRLRCCKRAQWEIRNIVKDMVKEISKNKNLYSEYLGAPCAITGKCPEGKHSCGNPYVYRRK